MREFDKKIADKPIIVKLAEIHIGNHRSLGGNIVIINLPKKEVAKNIPNNAVAKE
jgi:hypothetical protein